MRKIRFLCIIVVLSVLTAAMQFTVSAVSDDEISAPSAVLMDQASGEVLYSKNPHEVRSCASITKVMTMILVMEALDSGKITANEMVTASEHAASMGGSDIWLEPGEQMTVHDMIKATMVASANDAAVALAELICGSEDSFVEEMNKKAKQLGMKETVFKNCNGLDEEGHVTSAYDVAVMSRELIKHRKIYEYSGIWMDELRAGKTQIVNTNKLLKSYQGITGLKTGTTSQAGSCITATAERNGLGLIAVVLGSSSGSQRFKDAALLLDHGFAGYMTYSPKTPEEAVTEIAVENGMTKTVKTTAFVNDRFTVKKGEEKNIKYSVRLPDHVTAPVKKGDKIGAIYYTENGKAVGEYPIKAAEDVKEITLKDIFSLVLKATSA